MTFPAGPVLARLIRFLCEMMGRMCGPVNNILLRFPIGGDHVHSVAPLGLGGCRLHAAGECRVNQKESKLVCICHPLLSNTGYLARLAAEVLSCPRLLCVTPPRLALASNEDPHVAFSQPQRYLGDTRHIGSRCLVVLRTEEHAKAE